MPMEIKICGLKRVEDALMVNEFVTTTLILKFLN